MKYTVNYQFGIPLSKYQIIQTSDNIDLIMEGIEKGIKSYLCNNQTANLLLYQLVDTNPRFVSFDIIKSSGIPHLDIKICDRKKNIICQFYNNKDLHQMLYNRLTFLKDYDTYLKHLSTLNKDKLSKLYEEIYSKKPNFIMTKMCIITHLLDNKKREFIKGY